MSAISTLSNRIPSWYLATLSLLALDVSDAPTHYITIASPRASLSLAAELTTSVDHLATAVNSDNRTNPRVHLIRLRELIASVAKLEETVEQLETRVTTLVCRTAEAQTAQAVAEDSASRERVLHLLAHVSRLSTLYSCARHAGLNTLSLNAEAIAYEDVLHAEAANNHSSLVESIYNPAFRAAVRARVDAENL